MQNVQNRLRAGDNIRGAKRLERTTEYAVHVLSCMEEHSITDL